MLTSGDVDRRPNDYRNVPVLIVSPKVHPISPWSEAISGWLVSAGKPPTKWCGLAEDGRSINPTGEDTEGCQLFERLVLR